MTVPVSLGFLRGQVDYMKARGFTVRAITAPGPVLDRFAAEYRIDIGAVGMERRITPLLDVGALRRIRRLLQAYGPDIVHAHTPKGGLLGLLAAASLRAPVRIYHMRGLPFMTATGGTRRLLQWTERLSCRLAHRVLCVSESLRTVAVDAGLCPPSKIKVLGDGSGNGVDAIGRFNPDSLEPRVRQETRSQLGVEDDAFVVAFVGRIVRDKGIVELGEAWRQIRAVHPHAHLLVIGGLQRETPIPRDSECALRTDPRVHCIESTPEMPRWYAAMDLVVLPTYREGFPNVLLEAAAMRLPVVATRVPGCVDAVEDGTTGLLVASRDARALATAIQTYLADPSLRQRHGERARARVLARFRPETIWRALYDEYVRLLDETETTIRRERIRSRRDHGQADAADGAKR